MFDDIMSMGDDKTDPSKILQKLLEPDNIDIKTDLNLKKIKVLMQLSYYTKRMEKPEESPFKHFSEVITEYKVLLCSVHRKSRSEIIDGVKHIPVEPEAPLSLSGANNPLK